MKRVVIFVAVLMVGMFGCSKQEQQGDLYTIKIDHDAMFKGDIDISHIFTDDIDVIPLQTLDNVLLKESADYKICDNDIFVVSGAELCRFGKDGKFKNTIARKGRGPGELYSIEYWDIIEDSVALFTSLDCKLLIYSLDGSGFRETLSGDNYLSVKSVWYNNGKLNMLTIWEPYELVQYDISNGIITNILKCDSVTMRFEIGDFCNNTAVYDNALYFSRWGNDTVYTFDGEKVQPKFYFDLSKKMPIEKMQTRADLFVQYVMESNQTWFPRVSSVTDKYLFLTYYYGAAAYMAIHDMSSGETHASVLFDVDGLPVNGMRIVGDKFYFMVGVSQLMKSIPIALDNPSVNDKVKEKLKRLYSQIGEDDNPVIFVKRFK